MGKQLEDTAQQQRLLFHSPGLSLGKDGASPACPANLGLQARMFPDCADVAEMPAPAGTEPLVSLLLPRLLCSWLPSLAGSVPLSKQFSMGPRARAGEDRMPTEQRWTLHRGHGMVYRCSGVGRRELALLPELSPTGWNQDSLPGPLHSCSQH